VYSRYIKTRAYSNATSCQNLKAISEELSKNVSGSTASSPDIDVLHIYIYIYKHARIRMQHCVKISKQSVKNFWRFKILNKLTFTFLFI
jgi:hypothetical protein